jgi:hypothetical protein
VSHRNHDGELNASSEDAAAKTNKYLSEGNDANVGVWCPEWDEKGSADKEDRDTTVCRVLKVASSTDDPKWEEQSVVFGETGLQLITYQAMRGLKIVEVRENEFNT